MNSLTPLINTILAEWNPLEVPTSIATIEYSKYASFIAQNKGDKRQIFLILQSIILHDMNLILNENKQTIDAEIFTVSKKIAALMDSRDSGQD